MDYSRLVKYLVLFSQEKLEKYIGEDLLNQLMTEWENSTQKAITKADLADMIVELSGSAILKDSAFRYDLLSHMKQQEVDYIYSELPQKKQTPGALMDTKIETLSKLTWGPNPANNRLLAYLNMTQDVYEKKNVDETVTMNLESYPRFYELLDYQFVIKQRILNELNKDNELTRMLVHMPTGTGKTKTMMHTLVHHYTFDLKHDGLVIWLAHTTELLEQAYNTFKQVWTYLGDGVVTSYKVWGNRSLKDETKLEGIMFCGIQKLQAIKQSQPEVFERIVKATRLIVFDEAHKAAASETRRVVEDLMVKKAGMKDRALVGLTATPGRTTLTSDENKLFTNMFERRIIGIDIDSVTKINLSDIDFANTVSTTNVIAYFQKRKILSKLKKEQLTYEESFSEKDLAKIKVSMTNNGYTDFSSTALEIIGKNRSRNRAIMVKLRELSAEGTPTIVFACSVAHAKLLSYMLKLEDIPNALVIGDMSPSDRAEAISSFKDRDNPINILINYEVLTTGFDSTNIKCVFITRPTQSIVLYSQMLGRGLRGPQMGGNEECLLVDIKDNLGKFDADMAFGHFDAYWNNK